MFKILHTIPFSCLRSPFRYSTTSFSSSSSPKITATPSTRFIVDYLIDSLGFHEDEAVAVSSKAPDFFESKLQYVEGKLGISRDSSNFIHGLAAALYRSESDIENNVQIFRSFGWSNLEIATLFKAQPYCLSKSEAYISDKLNFFMKELKYTPCYLMGRTSFWTLSLEKRIKPRNEVLKILKEKEKVKDTPSLGTIVNYSELTFLSFLQRFESHIPSLCETYKNSLRDSKTK
ncbi:Mitochodrial transcription termination factor-related protein [Cynara cardunculus var. scolymus]|uniref:Mitochodrial transcription termination factor-related protein n=1 Tax=Cynara cardunculus var. scolymus TaxID=59895 RepID=A0A103YDQ6_CYNCS|nr:Mitochodrial transcription termination factor-related protein [Cynara cardunculus var. scolymus]